MSEANPVEQGAIDATILLPPFSFSAEAAGFSNLGLTADYNKELPFTAAVVPVVDVRGGKVVIAPPDEIVVEGEATDKENRPA